MVKKIPHIDKEKALYSNKVYFESCIKIAQKLFDEKLYEDCINYIEKTASFGWFNFSGYYKSESLEILLAKIQQKILPHSSYSQKKGKTNKVLHICSEIFTSGGHSKLLYNWIQNDNSKEHSILSTRLSVDEIKAISNFYLEDISYLEHISVKSSSKIESVNILSQLPLNDYDAIILHIHPDETITNIVLAQKEITTPVCLLNHADHVFWLGVSIADMILQIRESSIDIDVERRGIAKDRQLFLPIPIENKDDSGEQKIKSIESINLLSTGTSYKYNPNEKYNFLNEAYKIVQDNPEVIFNIVGINADSSYAKEYRHERIVCHGILSTSELADIEKTTDIYVEGFPMASFTALLQIALRKVPFVLHYQPLPLFKLFGDSNQKDAIIYPKDLQEWHDILNKLIRSKAYRDDTTQKQYNYIINNYSINIWKSRITQLYNKTEAITHSFWKPTKDKYYDYDNEKLLVTIDKRKFSHYNFTYNMSLRGKYLAYKMAKPENKNIHYLSKKQLLKYFLNK